MNPFSFIHTTADDVRVPLVSMEASHLVNVVNFFLVKSVSRVRNERRAKAYAGYAPVEMTDARQVRILGLRKMTQQESDRIEENLLTQEDELIKSQMEKAIPYIIVGVTRDDTRDGVVAILQKVTGITGRLDFNISRSIALLTSGNDDDDYQDDDDDWLRDSDEGDRD